MGEGQIAHVSGQGNSFREWERSAKPCLTDLDTFKGGRSGRSDDSILTDMCTRIPCLWKRPSTLQRISLRTPQKWGRYRLLKKNCEVFGHFLKTYDSFSEQASKAKHKITKLLAPLVFWTLLSPIVGIDCAIRGYLHVLQLNYLFNTEKLFDECGPAASHPTHQYQSKEIFLI